MTEHTLLAAFHALQQRRVREWSRMDSVARRYLLNAIKEIRAEIVERDHERKQFAVSWRNR